MPAKRKIKDPSGTITALPAKNSQGDFIPVNEIVEFNKLKFEKRAFVSTITLGWIRLEWAHARYGQVIPVNWAMNGFDSFVGTGFSIEDGYNLVCKRFLEHGSEWMILIEDDVIVPNNLYIFFEEYMQLEEIPIVSGLYFTKSDPAQPLLFRGRGNGPYHNWTLGEKVWVDGLPMGCLLIHGSIIQWFWDHTEEYKLLDGTPVKRIFETPRKIWFDPEQNGFQSLAGTQDLYWFDKVLEFNVLKECGFKKIARKKYPFLCDTRIYCRHINLTTGQQYPSATPVFIDPKKFK